jgi:hypothetical protein
MFLILDYSMLFWYETGFDCNLLKIVLMILDPEAGFDSRRYQIFWEVVGLERGALSLVSTIEELLDRK